MYYVVRVLIVVFVIISTYNPLTPFRREDILGKLCFLVAETTQFSRNSFLLIWSLKKRGDNKLLTPFAYFKIVLASLGV